MMDFPTNSAMRKFFADRLKDPVTKRAAFDTKIIPPRQGLILYYLLSLWLMAYAIMPGCSSSHARRHGEDTSVLRMKGSDTMLFLANNWAERFMQLHPEFALYVEGGGTHAGAKALINGAVKICTASRQFHAEEIQELVEKHGSLGISILSARDALGVYLNPANPVANLTLKELQGIFTGVIRNWQEVGGVDEPIVVLNRNPNSGTQLFFEERVLAGQACTNDAQVLPTTSEIVNKVEQNRNAIGYGGMAYGRNVKHVHIEGVEPSMDNVRNGTYPIARYLYLYTVQPPRGLIKHFVDWVLSEDGQGVVQEVGYVPLFEVWPGPNSKDGGTEDPILRETE